MNILGFDTSANACSVALLTGDKITEHHEIAPMQQAKRILPIINQLLAAEKITLKQLDAIAFGCGPGSFTGVRIATSVAQGLAFAAEKPLIPVSSLAALAQTAYTDLGWKKLIVAVDARMNECYWAWYEVDSDHLVKLNGKENITAPKAIQIPDETSWYGVGNAWDIYNAEIIVKSIPKNTQPIPTAKAIISLAKDRFLQGNVVPAREAIPVYLRDEVAKKSIHQK